jgi:acylphosphatase
MAIFVEWSPPAGRCTVTDITAIAATVSGRVHGVGFRVSTQRAAANLGLAGWVRNLPDGTVSVWAQGSTDAIRQITTFLERGPKYARVTSLNVLEVSPDEALTGFSVRS